MYASNCKRREKRYFFSIEFFVEDGKDVMEGVERIREEKDISTKGDEKMREKTRNIDNTCAWA